MAAETAVANKRREETEDSNPEEDEGTFRGHDDAEDENGAEEKPRKQAEIKIHGRGC